MPDSAYQRAIETEDGFSVRLRALRKERSMTQELAAANAGISTATWGNYESGTSHPTLFNLIHITMVLGLKDHEVVYLVLGARGE